MQRQFSKSETRQAVPASPSREAALAVVVLASMGASEARIMGRAPIPASETLINGWTFKRWEHDTCALPAIAWKRLVALHQAGIRPIDYVIAHEPQKEVKEVVLQPAKAHISNGWNTAKTQLAEFRSSATPLARQATEEVKTIAHEAVPIIRQTVQEAKALAVAATPLVLTVGSAAVMAAAAVGTVAMGALGVMASVLLADPILFCILAADDGGDPVWVEVARWWNED